MDPFEQLVSEILWMEGYWVRTSRQGRADQRGKARDRSHSAPRWEPDIVAYGGRDNLLRVIECKSFLDSPGVRATGFDGGNPKDAQHNLLQSLCSLSC